MGVQYNTSIVTSGLVLCLDAANYKSYDYRENLVAYSTYNASAWSNPLGATGTITTGISAPDGTNTAIRYTFSNTGNAILRVAIPAFTPNGTDTYTTSFYVRLISGTGTLSTDLTDGNPSKNYNSELITNQWVRIVTSGIPTATSKTFIDLISDTNTNYVLDFWGVQLEKSSTASTYTGTSGSTITRSTTLTDLSGNSINGTLTNGPTFNSGNGGSIVFDGTNDYAVTGSSASLSMNNSSVTVDVWIKITNFASGERMICEYGIWSATEVYQFTTIGNTLRFNFPAASSAGKATDYVYSPLTTNVWMHLVGMHNTSTNEGNIYVNGLLAATTTGVTQEIGAGTAALYIASRGGTTLYLPCSIGQLKIYNKALSAAEINQNFNALRGRYGI